MLWLLLFAIRRKTRFMERQNSDLTDVTDGLSQSNKSLILRFSFLTHIDIQVISLSNRKSRQMRIIISFLLLSCINVHKFLFIFNVAKSADVALAQAPHMVDWTVIVNTKHSRVS